MKKSVKLLMASTLAATFTTGAVAADKVLTMSHWAGPKHAMATKVHPWMNNKRSGGATSSEQPCFASGAV